MDPCEGMDPYNKLVLVLQEEDTMMGSDIKEEAGIKIKLDIEIEPVKEYVCVQCNFKASKHCKLQTHIMTKHSEIKYICDQCDYKATRKHTLIYINLTYMMVRDFCLTAVNMKLQNMEIFRTIEFPNMKE